MIPSFILRKHPPVTKRRSRSFFNIMSQTSRTPAHRPHRPCVVELLVYRSGYRCLVDVTSLESPSPYRRDLDSCGCCLASREGVVSVMDTNLWTPTVHPPSRMDTAIHLSCYSAVSVHSSSLKENKTPRGSLSLIFGSRRLRDR
jgi:hypothetical protein